MARQSAGLAVGFIAAVLGAAALGGVAVFVWQQNQLQQAGAPTPVNAPATASNTSTAPTDSRTLLTSEQALALSPDCNEPFNTDPATTTVAASVPKLGISLEVPFNPAWGSERFRIDPFEVVPGGEGIDAVMEFGSVAPFEGCGLVRAYSLYTLPATTTDAALASIAADTTVRLQGEPEVRSVGGRSVVQFTSIGLCATTTYEVIGPASTVVLRPTCGQGTPEEQKTFDDIIQSLSFL